MCKMTKPYTVKVVNSDGTDGEIVVHAVNAVVARIIAHNHGYTVKSLEEKK